MPLYNYLLNADISNFYERMCTPIITDYSAKVGDVLLALVTNSNIKITLPPTPTEGDKLDIFLDNTSLNSYLIIDSNGSKVKGVQPGNTTFVNLKFIQQYAHTIFVYDDVSGWCDYPTGQLLPNIDPFPGMKLWLNGSGLTDFSGSGNNATALSTSPSQVTGLDGKPFLRWNGSGNQELQISPFMAGTTAATVYIVFTVSNASNNYNLIRTANLDDYWRFSSDGNGYLGTFLNARFNAYPQNMPGSGSHLVSIHVDNSGYELLLDNSSKNLQSGNYYTPGDRFRIGTNDKAFVGDIGTLITYPFFISKNSAAHSQNIQFFKSFYPSLTLN